jgi:lysozyme
MIKGVDRSHLNSKIALASLVKEEIGFIWFKATQGETYKDPTFNAAWQEVKTMRGNLSGQLMKHGGYHFFDPRCGGIAQADNYLSMAINFSLPGCLPPCVDVEDLVGTDKADTILQNKWVADNWELALQRLLDFLNYIKQKTGKNCIIYTYNSYFKQYFHGKHFPYNAMWLSSLQKTCPKRYDTGTLPIFWQNTYNWNNTDMDGNLFTGSITELNALANII